jgi:hypothetical protein
MSDTSDFRVTIRLPPELYAQLEARGSHGQPMAAIVRQALLEYLARQPHTHEQAVELATAVAAMAARLDGLQDQVEQLAARLETLTAQVAATTAVRQPAPPQARTAGSQRKLTPRQIRALRDKHQRGVPVEALMEEYGISRASVFRYLQSEQRGRK